MTGKRNSELTEAAAAAGRSSEGMRPVFAMCQGLQKAVKPFADLQRQLQVARVPRFGLDRPESAFRQIIESQSRIAGVVRRLQLGSVGTAAWQLARHARRAQVLDEAGWLPHHSMPFGRVEECAGDVGAVHELLCRHYRERWSDVCRDIEARLAEYDIDDEAKATFVEALKAHEAGFYRSVCRVLMPEIERVSRVELYEGRLKGISSLPRLRELAGRLPITAVEPGGFLALNLFRRLSEHLYVDIWDEDSKRRFEEDPVPNRHAAVHGHVVYSSMQNSLNAIFMADFIFQAIGTLKLLPGASPAREAGTRSG